MWLCQDKSKILNNELDILHSEVHSKNKLLGQSRNQHQVHITHLMKAGHMRMSRRRCLHCCGINHLDVYHCIIHHVDAVVVLLSMAFVNKLWLLKMSINHQNVNKHQNVG